MTYSIVARDPETGELGGAVQSRWFAVGRGVLWAEAEVGAVATQSFAEPAYGPRGIGLMRRGMSAPDALRALTAVDPGEPRRQVARVDQRGEVGVEPGEGGVADAGHRIAAGVSAQANMMERSTVWDAMVDAYGSSAGELADRLLAALEAAEAEGGDIRGRQSAALLVVTGDPTGLPDDVLVDIRVDDHPEPLVELRRLLVCRRAYDALGRATELAGAGDLHAALAEAQVAAELRPEDDQIAFWHGLMLAGSGDLDQARAAIGRAVAANSRWRTFLTRLPAAGLLPDEPALLAALLDA
jgi:uncharacterized Ntn-hydrolase superfamily protein